MKMAKEKKQEGMDENIADGEMQADEFAAETAEEVLVQEPAKEAEAQTPEIKKREEGIEQEEVHISKQLKSIVFSVLSPKMIKDMASAKIVTPELYDKEGYPVDGGLMDIRLGVIDPGLRCKTCGAKLKECIGHFG